MATNNVNLYHVAKFSLGLSFTVHYVFTKISNFTPLSPIRTVLFSILRNSQLETDFAVYRKSGFKSER